MVEVKLGLGYFPAFAGFTWEIALLAAKQKSCRCLDLWSSRNQDGLVLLDFAHSCKRIPNTKHDKYRTCDEKVVSRQ